LVSVWVVGRSHIFSLWVWGAVCPLPIAVCFCVDGVVLLFGVVWELGVFPPVCFFLVCFGGFWLGGGGGGEGGLAKAKCLFFFCFSLFFVCPLLFSFPFLL